MVGLNVGFRSQSESLEKYIGNDAQPKGVTAPG